MSQLGEQYLLDGRYPAAVYILTEATNLLDLIQHNISSSNGGADDGKDKLGWSKTSTYSSLKGYCQALIEVGLLYILNSPVNIIV